MKRPPADLRYGVFLRPDPATCWTVTQVTFALNRQFGLVSAGAFPPHATLVGNVATTVSEAELISALDVALHGVTAFEVFNHGVARDGDRYGYNLNDDASGERPNAPLAGVADAVSRAVLPLSTPVDDYLVTPVGEAPFAAHLSLAGHELVLDAHLADEVGDFLAGLPLVPPAVFLARWYSLFEFRADWSTQWWNAMSWRHIRSWEAA